MKTLPLMAAAALALGLSACSGGSDCTPEALQKKVQEVTHEIQQKIAADPSKMQDLMKRLQDLGAKFQASGGAKTEADACKAYDELLKAVKG